MFSHLCSCASLWYSWVCGFITSKLVTIRKCEPQNVSQNSTDIGNKRCYHKQVTIVNMLIGWVADRSFCRLVDLSICWSIDRLIILINWSIDWLIDRFDRLVRWSVNWVQSMPQLLNNFIFQSASVCIERGRLCMRIKHLTCTNMTISKGLAHALYKCYQKSSYCPLN